MIDRTPNDLPNLFAALIDFGCLYEAEIQCTTDGFFAVSVAVSDILARKGIMTVPNRQGESVECGLFFDDWYLYAVTCGTDSTCGLFKMREQEYDAKQGRKADGDTPGVTVSFVALQTEVLMDCLQDPTIQNRQRLNVEINRVVAYRGQCHSKALKEYFIRTEAQGAYLIAKLYTGTIAALAKDGNLPVPERYGTDHQKQKTDVRVAAFLEENNRAANKMICDHQKIFVEDPLCPTAQERLAILATHTGNTSVFSFAAEVQFHAKFLTWWTRVPIPIIGRSPYDSAIRADMSIGDGEFTGPTPYYRANSPIVKAHYHCHKDTDWIKKLN